MMLCDIFMSQKFLLDKPLISHLIAMSISQIHVMCVFTGLVHCFGTLPQTECYYL